MNKRGYKLTNQATVFVQGGPQRAYKDITEKIFEAQDVYKIVGSVDDADIVVWTGGQDIYPRLYNEEPLNSTYYTLERDKYDLKVLEKAVAKNKFLVGICRGAQLLNVIPNNGKLWQDVDNHGSGYHKVYDVLSQTWINTNSVHHQMMKPGPQAEIVAYTNKSTYRKSEGMLLKSPYLEGSTVEIERNKDIEVLYYAGTKSLLVQFHPEFGHKETTDYFFELMERKFFRLI